MLWNNILNCITTLILSKNLKNSQGTNVTIVSNHWNHSSDVYRKKCQWEKYTPEQIWNICSWHLVELPLMCTKLIYSTLLFCLFSINYALRDLSIILISIFLTMRLFELSDSFMRLIHESGYGKLKYKMGSG